MSAYKDTELALLTYGPWLRFSSGREPVTVPSHGQKEIDLDPDTLYLEDRPAKLEEQAA